MDEAIGYINAHSRPLTLDYFGNQDAECDQLLARTTSGNVSINNTMMHVAQDDLPFGGVGPSGMGAYHGIEGFRATSHAKGVFIQGRWNLPSPLRAPLGKWVDLALAATRKGKRAFTQGTRTRGPSGRMIFDPLLRIPRTSMHASWRPSP